MTAGTAVALVLGTAVVVGGGYLLLSASKPGLGRAPASGAGTGSRTGSGAAPTDWFGQALAGAPSIISAWNSAPSHQNAPGTSTSSTSIIPNANQPGDYVKIG